MLVIILTSLASGLIGAMLSILYFHYSGKKKFKMETFKKFVSNRYDLKGDEFTRALNEIYVVFNHNEKIVDVLQNYHEAISEQRYEISQKYLVKLCKEMCKDLKIDCCNVDDSFFLTPFNTRESSR